MDTDTKLPRVTVLLAVYKPQEYWLAELLMSLNRQTYKNLELIICDDCPDDSVDQSFFQKYLSKFPWSIVTNEKNIGSNKTFERLTNMANGKYIAYCDQDDIWEDNKIELLVKRIEKARAELCFSDLSIIDENGTTVAGSITAVRKRHRFKEGFNLSSELIVRNFVTGCAMLIRTETAKAAIPFEEYMVHDHWLALFASLRGQIVFEPTATVKYRQHCGNQTAVLAGVKSKEDYYRLRIELLDKRVRSLKTRINYNEAFQKELDGVYDWVLARKNYFNKCNINSLVSLWKRKKFGVAPSVFEIAIPFIPSFLFEKVIALIK
jgi:glycosyltransferase involved in cell wall biosynthesis